MLSIENIHKLAGRNIGEWKIDNISLASDAYFIKVIRTTSPYDIYNLMVDRWKTKSGDYHISCFETNREYYLPIESIRDRDTFIRFIITELT